MLVTTLTDAELDKMLKEVQTCVKNQFGIWLSKTISTKNAAEEIFNSVDEIIYKTQMADEILTGMLNFRNSMYITEGDYEMILTNLHRLTQKGEIILEHMYKSFKANPDYNIVNRDEFIEAAYEQYADEMEEK